MGDSDYAESSSYEEEYRARKTRRRKHEKNINQEIQFASTENEVDNAVYKFLIQRFEVSKGRHSSNYKAAITDFLRLLIGYGFCESVKTLRINLLPARNYYAQCNNIAEYPNVIRLLLKIGEMDDLFGTELWDQHFFNMPKLCMDVNLDFAFRSSIVNCYMSCVFSEQKGDWASIAIIIGKLEAEKILGGRRYTIRPHSPYLPLLFLCSMQRNLALLLPTDLLNASTDTTVSVFRSVSFGLNDLLRNPTAFFELNSFIFKIANGLKDQAFQQGRSLVQAGAFQFTENEYNRALEWLNLVNQFEMYKDNRTEEVANTLLDAFVFQIESLVTSFMSEAVVLMPGVLELMSDLDDFESLDKICEVCCSDVSIFPTVCRVLRQRERVDLLAKVFGEVIKQNAIEVSRCEETKELMSHRSAEPENYGFRDDIVEENIPVVFGVLDLGRNRSDLKAWQALYDTLRRIESQPEKVRPFYERRRTWWPQFHSGEVDFECRKVRKKCFKRLRKCL
ncbi:unnamed protein product [Bursaphelenchus xylophilus]|uniref:(pine wood nematode) hypothetical protein n=1 Tax=Bursaphelenchus xylophilus TaxID=6326 RepID=A0A7I8WRC7_BURXY|nr:unnamed protein product [Bursaphelenchus xylophilus]CAG9097895.1 unnamed protein product [Bursaphelenchus xylophilus]